MGRPGRGHLSGAFPAKGSRSVTTVKAPHPDRPAVAARPPEGLV